MSDSEDSHRPQRKRRTREHVLEDISENHLERFVLLTGHILRRPRRDYGVDVAMFHFAKDGAIESGEVRFQLKATDALNLIQQGSVISMTIKTGDLHYWQLEIYPFILVVYDAAADRAFWLHIQEYVGLHPDCLDPDQDSVQVHIPTSNQLTIESIAAFREMSLRIVQELTGSEERPDDRRKPR
ncbi:DUF4365 domain-containing protein [Anatilimnocola floriformis]|uniref:DUF4365 domain-containing protein n=1 Tax=Anatilimnocola floriformis TaxID=2948575 RepID=UPI0020C301DB|nr:DUF4365 domain-containing protein [Anatilimnocola floriformis]